MSVYSYSQSIISYKEAVVYKLIFFRTYHTFVSFFLGILFNLASFIRAVD